MEDYYEYLDSNGVTTLYKLIKDDTVALIDSYSVTINGITTNLDNHINNTDIHTPITDIENMVDTKISGLVNSAPETLDTLKELSDALGNDPNFATTIANQIGNKANSVHSHVVSDITDFPTIPTKTSELINDSGYITSVSWTNVTDKPNFSTVATSGSYTDLSNTPTIPTKLSQLENDMGFGTGGDTSDCVHKTGDETIDGNKFFIQDVNVKNSDVDIAVTPSNNLFSCFRFRGKGNATTASIQYSQRTYGVNDICFYVFDASSNSHGFRIRTDNRLEPIENNTYSLGSSSSKWADVYSTNAHITYTYTNRVITYSIAHPTDNSYFYLSGGTNYDKGANLYLYSYGYTGSPGAFNLQAKDSTQSKNLVGFPNGTLTWGGKSLAIDENLVHTSGSEVISGVKTFNDAIVQKQSGYISNDNIDNTTTPSSNLFTHFFFSDKNNISNAFIRYAQRTNGVNEINLFVRDKDLNNYGVSLNTNNEFLPVLNNTYSLGSSGLKWANVYSTNDITNKVITYSVTNHNNTSSMTVSGGSSWDTGSTLFLYGNSDSNYPGAFNLTAKNTTNESKLIGFPNGTLTWNGKNVALDENLVHRTGNEAISGVKTFSDLMYIYNNMSNKNSQMDLFTTPTNTLYAHYMFVDKNNEVSAYMQYGQQNTGTDFIGLFIHDKNRALHGIQVTTNNEVIPISNNTYSLGSTNNKWANVYATTFNGNLNGNANSATYSTTPATSDNSTRIATTAWVRTYVDSVAGSNTVGSSVSAYWSNSSNVTATGRAIAHSSSSSVYPACYSDYVNKTPTVGTIYSGAQLYTEYGTSANATGTLQSQGQYSTRTTTTTAQVTFRSPISATGKYLCTTANTVKFRAYTTQGSTSTVGASSIVDYTITKSIFIRVQ